MFTSLENKQLPLPVRRAISPEFQYFQYIFNIYSFQELMRLRKAARRDIETIKSKVRDTDSHTDTNNGTDTEG